jgi:hypothetical protein
LPDSPIYETAGGLSKNTAVWVKHLKDSTIREKLKSGTERFAKTVRERKREKEKEKE